ncbi:hypothetical protein SAMN05216259_106381 [Actinacidiphila guanduensis]|uniref:Uncharacterized protein n=1 Tax=Actinacidiphila guanduensis TaxID=310781 RepID=A0A1H0FPV1_9ACTN|nr:hypothetical protein SAMN05216259_106381 [Actinacidiphila guanduensis]
MPQSGIRGPIGNQRLCAAAGNTCTTPRTRRQPGTRKAPEAPAQPFPSLAVV